MTSSLRSKTLTVLAYHEVADAAQLDRHLDFVEEHYTVLGVEEVVSCFDGELSVDSPAWITFDDGYPSVVEDGLPLLARRGMQATMFVCPGVIEGDGTFWWQVIEKAAESGVALDGVPIATSEVSALKSVSDEDRRRYVKRVRQALESVGTGLVSERLEATDIARWIAAGHSIGNHTWDHPLLDMCSVDEQTSQITRAHEWLREKFSLDVLTFAYPNGNATHHAERILAQLGYRLALLFDHRVDKMAHPLRVSRIRVNTTDTMAEFKAKVSGIHPFLHHMRRRIIGRS